MPDAVLYDSIGVGYRHFRRPDPRIAAALRQALGGLTPIINVGAGAGSYEPADGRLIAVEPSLEMIRQRPAGTHPVVQAAAEALPFADDTFAAGLAALTVHHWSDRSRGFAELRRVTRDRVVILTMDASACPFWLTDRYFPAIRERDRFTMPSLDEIREALGPISIGPLPIPHDCTDGFLGAYWRRPHAYLEPAVRQAISAFAFLPEVDLQLQQLRADLEDGTWNRLYGHLAEYTEIDLGYRLVIADIGGQDPRHGA